MKRTNSLTVLLVAGSLLALGGAGCKKRLQTTTPLPGYRVETPGGGDQRARPFDTVPTLPPIDQGRVTTFDPTAGGVGIPQVGAPRSEWNEDFDTFRGDTVYFDFDKSNVKPSEVGKIQSVADRFKTMNGKALRIDGHCDERGTEEYNRSLGERRALSVREALVAQGIAPDLIETRTYGEERPADPGHDEAAWSKNRRGEIVLLSPPVR